MTILCGTGSGTQGFVYPRQILYKLNYSPSLLLHTLHIIHLIITEFWVKMASKDTFAFSKEATPNHPGDGQGEKKCWPRPSYP